MRERVHFGSQFLRFKPVVGIARQMWESRDANTIADRRHTNQSFPLTPIILVSSINSLTSQYHPT